MFHNKFDTLNIKYTLFLGLLAAFFVISMLSFPKEAFEASLHGLTLWWKIIFPALLPFFILSEMMIAFGVLHFLGVCLEPLMRIVFRMPGISGPVIAIGYTVGYPMGGKLTSQLRKHKKISSAEGEVLLAISHAASPVMMISVVAVGYFGNVQLGFMLLWIQLISLMIMGLILKSYLLPKQEVPPPSPSKHHILYRSFKAMQLAHKNDNRSFGKLLGDSVTSSIQTLMMLGGYVILFSVILKMISTASLLKIIEKALKGMFPESIITPWIQGIFETNLGSYSISQLTDTSIIWQIAFVSFILAWSGFTMHAQIKTMIHATDLRYATFFFSRLLQACLAFILTFALWKPLSQLFLSIQPSFQSLTHKTFSIAPDEPFKIWHIWFGVSFHILLTLVCMLLFTFILQSIQFLRKNQKM